LNDLRAAFRIARRSADATETVKPPARETIASASRDALTELENGGRDSPARQRLRQHSLRTAESVTLRTDGIINMYATGN